MSIEKTAPKQFGEILKNNGLLQLNPQSKFQHLDWLPSKSKQVDRLTNLPILNNETRNVLVGELSQCVKENKQWACLNTDADQLKTANDKPGLGRDFGDEYIKWSAATVTEVLENASFSDEATIRIVRPSHAADEVIVWFFNLTDEDIKKIPKIQEQIEIPVPIPELSFTFSLSSGLLSSDDPSVKKSQDATQKWLLSDSKVQAFNLFQQIENITDELTKIAKISKDLSRSPLKDLFQQENITALISVMKNNLGGSRISERLLEIILQLQSVHTIRLLKKHLNYETYEKMLLDLGVDSESLNNVQSSEALVDLFRGLFGSSEGD